MILFLNKYRKCWVFLLLGAIVFSLALLFNKGKNNKIHASVRSNTVSDSGSFNITVDKNGSKSTTKVTVKIKGTSITSRKKTTHWWWEGTGNNKHKVSAKCYLENPNTRVTPMELQNGTHGYTFSNSTSISPGSESTCWKTATPTAASGYEIDSITSEGGDVEIDTPNSSTSLQKDSTDRYAWVFIHYTYQIPEGYYLADFDFNKDGINDVAFDQYDSSGNNTFADDKGYDKGIGHKIDAYVKINTAVLGIRPYLDSQTSDEQQDNSNQWGAKGIGNATLTLKLAPARNNVKYYYHWDKRCADIANHPTRVTNECDSEGASNSKTENSTYNNVIYPQKSKVWSQANSKYHYYDTDKNAYNSPYSDTYNFGWKVVGYKFGSWTLEDDYDNNKSLNNDENKEFTKDQMVTSGGQMVYGATSKMIANWIPDNVPIEKYARFQDINGNWGSYTLKETDKSHKTKDSVTVDPPSLSAATDGTDIKYFNTPSSQTITKLSRFGRKIYFDYSRKTVSVKINHRLDGKGLYDTTTRTDSITKDNNTYGKAPVDTNDSYGTFSVSTNGNSGSKDKSSVTSYNESGIYAGSTISITASPAAGTPDKRYMGTESGSTYFTAEPDENYTVTLRWETKPTPGSIEVIEPTDNKRYHYLKVKKDDWWAYDKLDHHEWQIVESGRAISEDGWVSSGKSDKMEWEWIKMNTRYDIYTRTVDSRGAVSYNSKNTFLTDDRPACPEPTLTKASDVYILKGTDLSETLLKKKVKMVNPSLSELVDAVHFDTGKVKTATKGTYLLVAYVDNKKEAESRCSKGVKVNVHVVEEDFPDDYPENPNVPDNTDNGGGTSRNKYRKDGVIRYISSSSYGEFMDENKSSMKNKKKTSIWYTDPTLVAELSNTLSSTTPAASYSFTNAEAKTARSSSASSLDSYITSHRTASNAKAGWTSLYDSTGKKKYKGYIGSDGSLYTGVHKINGKYYYFADGAYATANSTVTGALVKNKFVSDKYYTAADGSRAFGWTVIGKYKYFFNADGSYRKNCFTTIYGKKYYFDASGHMVTGYRVINNKQYYFRKDDEDGVLLTGNNNVVTLDDVRYVVASDGVLTIDYDFYQKAWKGNIYSYTVKYLDRSTGDAVHASDVSSTTANQTITVSARSISGYAPETSSQSVAIDSNGKTITFYYSKNSYTYTVRYVDAGTGRELSSSVSKSAKYGETVTENAKSIDSYAADETSKNLTVTHSGQRITFYYSKGKYSYTVDYIDRATGSKLTESVTKSVNINDTVNESAKTIDGYIPEKSTQTATISSGNTTITFYYNKNDSSVTLTIKYINRDTNKEIADSDSASLSPNEAKTFNAKSISYYTPEKTSINYTAGEDDDEIIFYYTRHQYTYTVYYSLDGGAITADEKTADAGSTVTETAKTYSGLAPDKETITFTLDSDDMEVMFTYTKAQYTYTVEYVVGDNTYTEEKTADANSEVTETAKSYSGYVPDEETITFTLESEGMGVTFTYHAATGELTTGKDFNSAIKQLAGDGSATYLTEDTNITHIKQNYSLPDSSVTTADVSEAGDGSVLAWYDDGTVYIYNKANEIADGKLIMNADSSYMFYFCRNLESIPDFDTSKVTNMSRMFASCNGLTFLFIDNWDTSNVTDMSYMFAWSDALEDIYLSSSFSGAKVLNANSMFNNCHSLESLNLSSFNLPNVTDTSAMFNQCNSIKYITLGEIGTAGNLTDTSFMFCKCELLSELTISKMNTGNVTNMSWMFDCCYKLEELILSSTTFSTNNVTNMYHMFYMDSALQHVFTYNNWNTAKVTNSAEMFYGCTNLPHFNSSEINKKHAYRGGDGYFEYSSPAS